MELQFPKKTLTCLNLVKREIQSQEQTQELRMPEDKPDIGKILGAWGQVLLRGKEWRDGMVMVSGGVMTWILYQPEGEDVTAQTVEAWIPFQMKWEIPPTQRDGTIRVVPLLRSVDARTTSARKMVARVTVSVLMEAHIQEEMPVCQPPELPEDVNLRVSTYPLMLPRENGEIAFEMEEELSLPSSCEKPEQIIRFSLQPEILDQKVLSGKVVFRGVGILHLLYRSVEGNLCTWDTEIPFSRYAELDDIYEQEAQPLVTPVVTGLELDMVEEKLLLKAALAGQYLIFDRSDIEIAQDAYSNLRQVEMTEQPLELPVMLDRKMTSISAEAALERDDMRIVDIAFYPDQPRLQRTGDVAQYALSGQFHMLLCDDHQQLQGMVQRWNGNWELQASSQVMLHSTVLPSGLPHQVAAPGGTAVSGDILLDTVSEAVEGMPMLCALEIGAERLPDASRPSLILRKMRDDSLWDIAKACGSTVEAIRHANRLEGEPDPNRMLLIPVL